MSIYSRQTESVHPTSVSVHQLPPSPFSNTTPTTTLFQSCQWQQSHATPTTTTTIYQNNQLTKNQKHTNHKHHTTTLHHALAPPPHSLQHEYTTDHHQHYVRSNSPRPHTGSSRTSAQTLFVRRAVRSMQHDRRWNNTHQQHQSPQHLHRGHTKRTREASRP